ncbi:hypothetical protein PPACK8108_LOCUS4373 [Phakopsora pachyrhizi]|uniref:Uncharacterized protein n=1 Tax=Phakopsora pachyrhizi TaxID=170000 RepID=A0AAV0ANX4_PHAPC|nr:hypothetical protein PPACK8108_LOCUS4373 [Phakopsora pachyrhizi]
MPVQGQKEGATDASHDQYRKYPKPVGKRERAWAGWKPETGSGIVGRRVGGYKRRDGKGS